MVAVGRSQSSEIGLQSFCEDWDYGSSPQKYDIFVRHSPLYSDYFVRIAR